MKREGKQARLIGWLVGWFGRLNWLFDAMPCSARLVGRWGVEWSEVGDGR